MLELPTSPVEGVSITTSTNAAYDVLKLGPVYEKLDTPLKGPPLDDGEYEVPQPPPPPPPPEPAGEEGDEAVYEPIPGDK